MQKKFSGTGVALVTPFDANGNVDHTALAKLVHHLVDNGIDYLVVQGTTGESVTLTQDEKREVLATVVKENHGRLPVVLGHGGNNTHALVKGFESLDLSGVDAILSVSPYYNKPTQEGIYQHFMALAEASPKPIILYNVPPRTSSNMTAETTLRLANASDKFIGIKEASGDLDQIGRLVRDRPEGFLIISGDDGLIVPHMALGGDGIISVIGNALPKDFSDLVNAALAGNFGDSRQIFLGLIDILKLLFVEGNPAGVKAALEILGIGRADVRLPLINVSDATYSALKTALEKR